MMADTTDPNPASVWRRRGLATAAVVLAALALLAPWMAQTASIERVGVLLVVAAAIEMAQGFRRATASAQHSAWVNGGLTLAMGVLLVNAPWLAGAAIVVLLAGWFAIDAARRTVGAARSYRSGQPAAGEALAALGNLAVAGGLVALGGRTATWAVAIAGALRILATGMSIARAPTFRTSDSSRTVVEDLGLPDRPEIGDLARDIEAAEARRAPVDRGWIAAFGLTLFAIHLGRTGFDRSFLGIMTPGVAVLGDFVISLIISFIVIIPVMLAWRKLTRGLERRAWSWYLAAPGQQTDWRHRVVRALLTWRLRGSVRLRRARYSLRAALGRGLQTGLPVAAIIAATAPVFGMSWYFDTENWAAGMWNSWAEERTDTWRAAMVEAEEAQEGPGAGTFSLAPAGVEDGTDFSFVVIGDTGEGDASQHVLRDSYLDVVWKDDVKFVVLSSDVIYPVGAMRDYEAKFWLPFKGTHKPVYAIPGNHDWYDALEAFNATFLQPDAARAAMRARIEVDLGLTTTTDAHIENLIAQASRLRREYEVPTGFQQAPFFKVETDRFLLVTVDTGVARTVDPVQWDWLGRTLDAARGKLVMAVVGHPFYAGGNDTVGDSRQFGELRQLLLDHGVRIVMAGDTHDLEYYAQPAVGDRPMVHHFVNGGGGAYMSFGTALSWPDRPAFPDWAYYPTTSDVVGKIEATTPWWKWPVWWWTRRFDAWPFSAEWLSAMFDVNQAPFFQSFVEVIVEPSAGRVRLRPYGIYGPLRWSDFQMSGTLKPLGVPDDGFVEWTVEMPGTDADGGL